MVLNENNYFNKKSLQCLFQFISVKVQSFKNGEHEMSEV